MVTTYERMKSVSPYIYDDNDNILTLFITTINNDNVLKHTYTIEYDLQRQYNIGDEGHNFPGVSGTYIFTKMYESWEFFEVRIINS